MQTIMEALKQGEQFVWGPIVKHHHVGRYDLIEHKARVFKNNCGTEKFKGTEFSIFVDGRSISCGAATIEEALALAMANKYDGCNSQAGQLFLKMIGFPKKKRK